MAKISKNIQRLRKAQGKTQEQLADYLHVTRQAISNWENNKTQPDIDTLTLLASFFDVEIEELIYGEKRQVGTEPDPERKNMKVRIVLGIVGSVFVGVGLILIFFTFWADFPLPLQTVCSVLPMLGAQAFAAYVFLRRREDVVWRECGAILWCLGMIATVALINSVFDIHCGFQNCLLIDILLCLPVFYLLNAVSPLTLYFYMVLHWSSLSANTWIAALLLLGGLGFLGRLRGQKEDVRYKFTVWVSAIAGILFLIMRETFRIFYYGDEENAFISLIAFMLIPFLALYAADKNDSDYTLPYKPLGVLGCAGVLTYLSTFGWFNPMDFPLTDVKLHTAFAISPIEVFCVLLLALGVLWGRKSFADNPIKILLCAFAGGGVIFSVVANLLCIAPPLWAVCLCAAGFAGTLLYHGIQDMKLLPTNLGLLMLFAQIVLLLNGLELGELGTGILLVVFGVGLIVVNYEMQVRKREAYLLEKAKREKEESEDA